MAEEIDHAQGDGQYRQYEHGGFTIGAARQRERLQNGQLTNIKKQRMSEAPVKIPLV